MYTADLTDAIALRGGVVRTSALRGLGATASDIRRAHRAGEIMRLREGVLALPSADPDVRDAARHGGEVACVSALRRAGVWIFDPLDPTRAVHALHVWVGGSGRRHRHGPCACITHNDAGTSGFGSTSIVLALVQVARCQGAECFFAAFESAWHRGLLTRRMRKEVRAGLPASMRYLVDLARPDADSGLESLLRLRLHRIGITLQTQVWIAEIAGRVDFLLDGILILETDGRENHDGPSRRHQDLLRDARTAALGFDTLRFDYAMVIHDWPVVEAAILARRRVLGSRLGRMAGVLR